MYNNNNNNNNNNKNNNNNNNNFILNYPFTTGAHTVGVAAVHQNLYTYIYMQIKGNQIFKKYCVYSVIV